jgi:uncharacterized membrane protein YedE/YeeE
MGKYVSSVAAGLLFGLGLAHSQMTHATKVLDFLDVVGDWDPSLAFVLGGAVGVTVIAFRFILRRPAPVFGDRFHLPRVTAVDRSLILGAALFGVGWGIGGYCPGPAVALLAAPSWEAWVFLPAMLLGALLQNRWASWRRAAGQPSSETTESSSGHANRRVTRVRGD